MSKRKSKRSNVTGARRGYKTLRAEPAMEIKSGLQLKLDRYCEVVFLVALFLFGVYQSILYFGHTAVPISDFPALYQVGRDILSFRLPVRFMQAPVLGMLQVGLSYIVGGHDPNLQAGWLLNAIIHPFNLVLMYLVAKQIVGKAGLWLAVLAILNPWVVYLMTEPIVETTYMFFILLTFYLMFRRSKWCYLAASITTMVRYEGAALIAAAFVLDMAEAKDNRRRVNALVYSALACIPLGLWLLGTYLTWSPNTTHYFNVWGKGYEKSFKESVADRTGIGLHLRLLWQVGFRPLLTSATDIKTTFRLIAPTAEDVRSIEALYTMSKVVAAIGAGFGVLYGLVKRNLKIIALLIFFIPYFLLHASYPYPLQRFHTTIFWIALLLFWFGVQSIWSLIDGRGRLPRAIVLGLQALITIISLIWLIVLFPYLSKVSSISPPSASVPYAAIALIAAFFAVRLYIYRVKGLARELAIFAVAAMLIVSNQFRLVPLVNDGQKEAEFKNLAAWYADNTKPGEKMGLYMSAVVRMFAPDRDEDIFGLPKAENPAEFVKACREQDLTYVVWATREGFGDHAAYRRIGLDKNIAQLREPKDNGPYKFVTQVRAKRGYVNIFRLQKAVVPDG
ncbi:MAG: hypothetical protein JXN61_09155 [Sedimentisphaerales bacterium]|nr:hypothetical protein [Sedimentisphaerales bacterium]